MANKRGMDYGRELVDKDLEELEEKIGKLYTQATYELDEKLSSYFAKFAEEDEKKLAQLATGQITDSQYEAWRRGRIIGQESWFNMRDRLAQDLTHYDQIAATMINEQMPSIYATSYNFGAFDMEMQSSVVNVDLSPFTIYNTEAVKMLMKDDPDLLPSLTVNRNRDLQWNRQHIQSAIAQGIIQGDSMDKIASRLQRVTEMDRNAALRNARTATNGAENAGRQAIADQCVAQGVPMIKEWSAVKDGRTRDSHLLVDGEQREENEPFSNGLMKAGDPHGNPSEVYNCRCATLHLIKGIDHSRDFERYQEMLKEENYEDWLRAREAEQDEASWWHNKKLEQEYGYERQARLRGQLPDKWDDTLTEADIIRERDEFFNQLTRAEKKADIPDIGTWIDKMGTQTEQHLLEIEAFNLGEEMTEAELSGLQVYTGSAYDQMNSYLRNIERGMSIDDAKWDAGINDRTLEHLENARNGINSVTLGEDMILRRGTDAGDIAGAFMKGDDFYLNKSIVRRMSVDELNSHFAGQVGNMAGFTSTSALWDRGFDGSFEIVYYAPANTRGSSIMSISQYGVGEGETLLAPDTKIRFLRAEASDGHASSSVRVYMQIITDDDE